MTGAEMQTLASTPSTPNIHQFWVTAQQMRDIEGQMFAAGMPVAALMEKVAERVARRIQDEFPLTTIREIGVLAGPGHNGGDALVVARELWHAGYTLQLFCPFSQLKTLTADHFRYAQFLGIPTVPDVTALHSCGLILDGLFGFGLERAIDGAIAQAIDWVNQWSQQTAQPVVRPVVSIDLPSGLDTDTGTVLGTAIRATHTLCLGLWKLGLGQDRALDVVGRAELIDCDIPESAIQSVVGDRPQWNRLTTAAVRAALPLPRSPRTHKYRQGHLLVIAGSQTYSGAALLTGLGARASGVGMVTLVVPKSLKPLLVAQLPEALVVGCPETPRGAIAQLPEPFLIPGELARYDLIACGPGLTREPLNLVQDLLTSDWAGDRPLLLDADALNLLAQLQPIDTLANRTAWTVLTPHPGEFQRLFPSDSPSLDSQSLTQIQQAAQHSNAHIVWKGARVAIAHPEGRLWINPTSTPALARGGSGDVLTGLMGGLLAQAIQQGRPIAGAIHSAVWWHAQAGMLAAAERTELGVDAFTLTQFLTPALQQQIGSP